MKKPTLPTEVDHIDEVRKHAIEIRNNSFAHWPETIDQTVFFSHMIAWLGYCEALMQWNKENE